MKIRITALLVCLLLIIPALCACGNSNPADTSDTSGNNPASDTSGSTTTAPDSGSQTPESVDTVKLYSSRLDGNGRYPFSALDYVTVPEFSPLIIPADTHTVSQNLLDAAFGSLLSSFKDAELKLNRAVKYGDNVNIDYVGSVGGVEFEGGSTGGAGTDVIIGYTSYIDDFLEQLVGHMPGETVRVEVTFPDNYGKAELDGKDAVFVTVINYICSVPELTDEFVATNFSGQYGCNTLSELTSYITDSIRNTNISEFIIGYISKEYPVSSVPQELVDHQFDMMREYYRSAAANYSMTLEDYLTAIGTTMEELTELNRTGCESDARYALVCQALAEKLNLTVGGSELVTYFTENFGSADYSAYSEYYGEPYLKQFVQNELVVTYLKESAVLG